MNETTPDRRRFIALMTAAAGAALSGCQTTPPTKEDLLALLDLQDSEREWVSGLSQEQVTALCEGLTAGEGAERARAIELAVKMLEPRERLVAYVGYPTRVKITNVCDALYRE